MRLLFVVDDNGDEFTNRTPKEIVAELDDVIRGGLWRLKAGDRSGVLRAEDNRVVGGFELTLGETEGKPGWERTR